MVELTWSPQVPPLTATAVAASGELGALLAERALGRERQRVHRSGDWTIVVGDDLPWLDGVVYLGALPGVPTVLVPVHQRPDTPPELLAAAIRHRTGMDAVAVLPTASGAGAGTLVALPS